MTADKDFKRIVRATARRTGQPYSTVLRRLRARGPAPQKETRDMTIFRTVPDIRSLDLERSKGFYRDLLGFELVMDQDGMLMFGREGYTRQQITVNGDTAQSPSLPPGFSIDVGWPEEVTRLFEEAREDGHTILEPVTDKPMGIRRFSLLDPDGNRVTVMAHSDPRHQPPR
jgi:catechol 2,3-dioxygenase-like lactoylglutathione lyase family enzyme